ncbi:MAG: glycoside hydrolase family 104 protein [Cyanobacteriota bacterium]|jgi:muramidase (phage lysozyme)|nr:glycoside hydrolase family 104 protein [Cyanobacteriota bacterium]
MHARFSMNLRHRFVVATLGLAVLPVASGSAAWATETATLLAPEPLSLQQPASDPGVSPFPLRVPLPAPAPRIYVITPERRALLNTIRYAEGTWANGDEIGYRIMFGGGLMPDLERHPDRVIRRSRYASAAAGAYQFMPFTWRMVTSALGLQRFDAQVQDQGALFLIQRRGALALADQGIFTPHLAHRLAPEWASFPTLAGRSYYGQPVKRFDDLRRFYERNLAELRSAMADQPQPTTGSQDSPG